MRTGTGGPNPRRAASQPGIERLRRSGAELLGLVLPVSCAGCGDWDVRLCPSCRAALAHPPRPVPLAPAPSGGRLAVPVWAGPDYAGAVARVLVAWKDRDRDDLTGPLAQVLAASVRAALRYRPAGPAVSLVAVPSAPWSNRRRGRDALAGLTVRAARELRRSGVPAGACPALRVGRSLHDQAGLNAAGRAVNVSGAFTVRTQLTGRLLALPVVIVDDVTTTGASLAEAIRAIAQVGGRVVAAATVCTTPLRVGGQELVEDHSLVRCRTPRDWSSVGRPLRLTAQRSRKEGAGSHD